MLFKDDISIFENPVGAHQITGYDPNESMKKYSIQIFDQNKEVSLGKFKFAVKVI